MFSEMAHREFLRHFTVAMLVFLKNGTSAMMVFSTNPPGMWLYYHANVVCFVSVKNKVTDHVSETLFTHRQSLTNRPF